MESVITHFITPEWVVECNSYKHARSVAYSLVGVENVAIKCSNQRLEHELTNYLKEVSNA